MGYYEFKIEADAGEAEALIGKVSSMGSLGCVLNEGLLCVYFPDILGIDGIVRDLTSFRPALRQAGLPGAFRFDYVFISERDWNESWKKKFQPIDLGDRLTVIPPWEREREGRVSLVIDPGMAFGTGHHETTIRCLVLIERCASDCARKESFLDVGTGTGILAIGASKLGFRKVLGVDTDPLAVDAARRNVIQNRVDNVSIVEGSVTAAPGVYDFIAANLLSETLMSLAADIASRLGAGGTLVTSGMIEGQQDEVIERMKGSGLSFRERHLDGRWVSVVFRR